MALAGTNNTYYFYPHLIQEKKRQTPKYIRHIGVQNQGNKLGCVDDVNVCTILRARVS